MPERTAYKTDANGNVVPFTYLAPAQPDPMQEQQKLIDQAYRDLPLEQAEQAAMAAMVYQGRRGYARDLEKGLSAPEALSKWAPLMFGRTPGQGAAMVRANPMQQQPRVMDIPGGGKMLLYGNTMQVIRPEAGVSANTQASLDQRNKEFQYRQQQDAAKPPPVPKLDQKEDALMKADIDEMKGLQKWFEENPLKPGNLLSSGNVKDHEAKQAKLLEIQKRIAAYGTEASPVKQLLSPQNPKSVASTKKVRVKNPAGQWGYIPESQLKTALGQGFTQ